jgi:ribosomal protein S18 acetylase RimI-like enzyme
MNVHIRRARPDEAATLTEIAHAAKRHWGYPEEWIEYWKPDLTITLEFIANNDVFVAVSGEEIVGCCALVLTESLAELEHMWIRPEYIGSGVGRSLFDHVKAEATQHQLAALELSADPNAEGFYERMGARRVGDVRGDIDGRSRVLPRMRIELGVPPSGGSSAERAA